MMPAQGERPVPDIAPKDEVVFKNVVESLFVRALGSKLSLRCVERIRDGGIDLRFKLTGFYLRETFYRCVRIAGEELFPGVDQDQQMVMLGTVFMEGFEQTLIGRAALTAARFMGTRRTLERMANNFRTSNNYMQVDFQEVRAGEVLLTLSQTSGVPGYFEGALRRGLLFAGARDLVVRREAYDGSRCTMRITWKP